MREKSLIKLLITLFLLSAGLIPLSARAQQDNALLQQMADADQQERAENPTDWRKLNRQDSIRRAKVFELIGSAALRTAKDHFNAGIILQHGEDTIASALAVSSFATAIAMDTTLNRWWYAAAVDRDLMRRAQPQVYGTQFIRDTVTGKWYRYKIDSNQVSDASRRYYSVETLAEQAEKERLMNQQSFSDVYRTTRSLDKTIDQIKLAFEKGRLSAYSLEMELNQFGYELFNGNKREEALVIFKLNTELYPQSYNTFDSYGECLMSAGKRRAAIKAYKKSLQLNPGNERAKRALETGK